jgi:hypothetical protein
MGSEQPARRSRRMRISFWEETPYIPVAVQGRFVPSHLLTLQHPTKEQICSYETSVKSTDVLQGCWSRKLRLKAVGSLCADHAIPLYPQKLTLTLRTNGDRPVGIVCLLINSHGVLYTHAHIALYLITSNYGNEFPCEAVTRMSGDTAARVGPTISS